MAKRVPLHLLILPVAWLALGVVASFPYLGVTWGQEVAYWPLVLPALPFCAIDSRFGSVRVTEGYFWGSGHGPPCLSPASLAVVYFLPALFGILWTIGRSVYGPWARAPREPRRTSASPLDRD